MRHTLSPRRRRLRIAIGSVSTAAVLGIVVGVVIYLKTRPALYRPDEKEPELTSSLSRNLPADAPKPRFTDMTRAAGLDAFRTFVGQRTSQLPEDMGSGVAWGDFNNDGYEDLFLVSAGGPLNAPTNQLAPCALYENLGNGAFRQVADFPELRIHGMGAAWGDYDGDGWLDLVVTGYNALLLFHNEPGENGRRKFVRDPRFADRKGFWAGATWGDYDNDRRLDLYVCGYVQYVASEADQDRASLQLGTSVPYTLNPSSYQPGLNLLFHNNGDGTLTEVAEKLGVTDPTGRSLSALWYDFDDDGWLDLYVANDVSDNVFYYNRHGTFGDLSYPACVADYRSGMGLAAGDWNRDGDDDFFVTHWVGQENALYDNLLVDLRSRPAGATNRPAASAGSTNAPPLKPSPLRFMDIADSKGLGQIALPYVGWGTEFADFDGDGWLDLVVANGSTLELEGTPKRLQPQEAFLFWNRRGEYFYNLAPLNEALSKPHVSRGLAVADYDNDGAMDILIVHLGEGVQLLHNEMQTGRWLKVRLRSQTADGRPLGFGDGSKVIAHLGDIALRRAVASASYLSQSSRVLHFGLGTAKTVDRLEVRWHAGQTAWYTNLEANATWELTEGDPTPRKAVFHEAHVGRGVPAEPINLPAREPLIARSSGRDRVSRSTKFRDGSMPSLPVGGSAAGPKSEVEPAHESLVRSPGFSRSAPAGLPVDEKARLVDFWNKHRAAINAMKVEQDIPKAIQLFRAALALNPQHEDAHYYLGQCLAREGDTAGALAQLEELTRISPQSHRGYQQWGTLRAIFSTSDADLAAAEKSLEKAHALNPEETGALLVLGEVALLRHDPALAEQRLTAACRTNPRAAGGFFLRAYLAWKRGEGDQARALLAETRQALGKEWVPKGATAEGDVKQKWHVESTPLSPFWEHWDGAPDPGKAFAALDARLARGR
ncbi:MAG: FG-GAP-like repeat-containing protein [Limisphaerales bacterium]